MPVSAKAKRNVRLSSSAKLCKAFCPHNNNFGHNNPYDQKRCIIKGLILQKQRNCNNIKQSMLYFVVQDPTSGCLCRFILSNDDECTIGSHSHYFIGCTSQK